MNKNRFEQVDEPADDAMTLLLKRDGEKLYGVVTCPRSAAGDRLPRDFTSDDLPLKTAIQSAIGLANELKVALVICDPDGLWQTEWGDLYCYEGDESDAP